MKNLQNVVTDVLEEIHANRRIREVITYDENEEKYTIVLELGVSRFEAEVGMRPSEWAWGAVTRRVGFGPRFEQRFMDTLMSKLV